MRWIFGLGSLLLLAYGLEKLRQHRQYWRGPYLVRRIRAGRGGPRGSLGNEGRPTSC